MLHSTVGTIVSPGYISVYILSIGYTCSGHEKTFDGLWPFKKFPLEKL